MIFKRKWQTFVGALTLFPLTTIAQDFEISPVIVEIDPKNGPSYSREITINNYSDEPKIFKVTEYDFLLKKDGSYSFQEFGSTLHTLKNYFTVNPSSQILQPNESGTFLLEFHSLNFNMMRWSKLAVTAENEEDLLSEVESLGTGIRVKPSIAILIYQNADKRVSREMNLSEIEQFADSNGTRYAIIEVSNQSKARIRGMARAYVTSVITGIDDEFAEKKIDVLPGLVKEVRFEIPSSSDKNDILTIIIDQGKAFELKGVQSTIE